MSLEDKVEDKESKGFMRKAAKLGFNLAVAGATTALSMATIGAAGPIIGGLFAGGAAIGSAIKKKPLYDTILETVKTYSTINAIAWPVLSTWDATVPLIPNDTMAGKVARSLYAVGPFNVLFTALYGGARHLIDNYLNPAGITKSISNNFANHYKRSAIGFAPAYILAANGLPTLPINVPLFNVPLPTFAANAFGLGLYNALYPVPVAKKPTPTYMPSYAPAPAH